MPFIKAMGDVLVRRSSIREELSEGVVCRPGMAIGDIVTDLLSLPTTGIPGKNRGREVGLLCWKQGGHDDCCDQ